MPILNTQKQTTLYIRIRMSVLWKNVRGTSKISSNKEERVQRMITFPEYLLWLKHMKRKFFCNKCQHFITFMLQADSSHESGNWRMRKNWVLICMSNKPNCAFSTRKKNISTTFLTYLVESYVFVSCFSDKLINSQYGLDILCLGFFSVKIVFKCPNGSNSSNLSKIVLGIIFSRQTLSFE